MEKNRLVNFETVKYDEKKAVDVTERVYLPANQELVSITNTPIQVLENHNNWVFANGDIYYLKDNKGILAFYNELMGEAFTSNMGLKTVEYKVAVEDGKVIGLLSKDFKKNNVQYKSSMLLSRHELQEIRKYLMESTYGTQRRFKKDLVTYLLNNFFMSLEDRFSNTIVAYDECLDVQIAPIYDYESAFMKPEEFTYNDPIITYSFNPASIDYLIKNNPYFEEVFNKLMNLDMNTLYSLIEEKKGIEIPDLMKEHYDNFMEERKRYVRTLM